MRGVVRFISPGGGMVAIETGEGFTVASLLATISLNLEDEVAGKLDNLGSETFRHVSSGERFDVFVERIGESEAGALAACR
jgi:hypothetical protein